MRFFIWFLKPFTSPPHQWHPLLIHFPIAFLFAEMVMLWKETWSSRPARSIGSDTFLKLSVWLMLPVVIAGIHDSGLDLGPGNPIWLGLHDRYRNAFNFSSSISVHALLMTLLLLMTAFRLLLRWHAHFAPRKRPRLLIDLGSALLGLGFLIVGGYAAGMVNHP